MSEAAADTSGAALVIADIAGSSLDPEMGRRLHRLAHDGAVETVRLAPRDMTRKRLRAVTDHGTPVMIALPRSRDLFDGAVLMIDGRRAIVLRAETERWLRLRPATAPDALRLGYAAGNLHWRVRFAEGDLEIALEGPSETYLARIRELVGEERVRVVEGGEADA